MTGKPENVKQRKRKETFGRYTYIHFLDCIKDFIGVKTQIVHFKYIQFIIPQ